MRDSVRRSCVQSEWYARRLGGISKERTIFSWKQLFADGRLDQSPIGSNQVNMRVSVNLRKFIRFQPNKAIASRPKHEHSAKLRPVFLCKVVRRLQEVE